MNENSTHTRENLLHGISSCSNRVGENFACFSVEMQKNH